ncbi:MAG: di-trans,poly-cis-decaprenylcistransferase [Candidatus Aenigmatarchaeota archaeon]|nr:MAG: di-trans,poly-cis-decaprenylcistransferase [Candidatus Aenigmarchaeota archaeon]
MKKGLHLGIIPDGSRRWGRRNDKPPSWDGKESGEKVREILLYVLENYPEITEVTVWAMSTENFKRNTADRERVFSLVEDGIRRLLLEDERMRKEQVRIKFFGSKLEEIPKSLRNLIKKSTEATRHYKGGQLNVALGYGGKFEIVLAAISLAKKLNEMSVLKNISEKVFEKFLMIPRPLDLIIRTGGEKRLSGFMLYQAEYAELFFLDTLWPDFTTRELDDIMKEFKSRQRRFGK